MVEKIDISTYAGANWTGYDWTPDRAAYVRQTDARPVWSAQRSAGTSRFQTRGSLRVVKIGTVCPDCYQTYRPNGGCGCDD
jgi:hypothetical protein